MAEVKFNLRTLALFNIMVGGFLIICFLAYGWAEADTNNQKTLSLGKIVITASRSEKKIRDIAAHAGVISPEKIEKQNILTLDQALSSQSGLSSVMVQDMTGTSRQISLRGFRGQGRTQILLNGHPVNGGYNGQVDWASLPISNLERLEIVKGPYSALYGGAAMGGTIQIITRDSKETNLYIKELSGQDRTKSWRLHFGTGIGDRLSFSFGYDHTKTDGYIDQYVVKKINLPGGGPGGGGGGITPITGWTPTQKPTGEKAYIVGDKGEHWTENHSFTTQLSFDLSPTMTLKTFFMNQDSGNGFGTPHSTIYKSNGDQVWKGTLEPDPNQATISLKESDFLNGEMDIGKNT